MAIYDVKGFRTSMGRLDVLSRSSNDSGIYAIRLTCTAQITKLGDHSMFPKKSIETVTARKTRKSRHGTKTMTLQTNSRWPNKLLRIVCRVCSTCSAYGAAWKSPYMWRTWRSELAAGHFARSFLSSSKQGAHCRMCARTPKSSGLAGFEN